MKGHEKHSTTIKQIEVTEKAEKASRSWMPSLSIFFVDREQS
jgi:hypothetical protein